LPSSLACPLLRELARVYSQQRHSCAPPAILGTASVAERVGSTPRAPTAQADSQPSDSTVYGDAAVVTGISHTSCSKAEAIQGAQSAGI
jgi:hypothetical protein